MPAWRWSLQSPRGLACICLSDTSVVSVMSSLFFGRSTKLDSEPGARRGSAILLAWARQQRLLLLQVLARCKLKICLAEFPSGN